MSGSEPKSVRISDLGGLKEVFASAIGKHLKGSERIILIANNPNIPDEVFATLGIGQHDFVVQFNLAIHSSWTTKSKNLLIFQNNHLGSAWGFDARGVPDVRVQKVIHSENPPSGLIFTSKIPEVVAKSCPSEIPRYALPSRSFIGRYPNRSRGRNPSAGYFGYQLVLKLLKLADMNVPVYLVGFSGRTYSVGQSTPHDWLFEQHVIQADRRVIRVFCNDRSQDFLASRSGKSREEAPLKSMPAVELNLQDVEREVQLCNRREDILRFVRKGGVGVELGVAEGEFSERVLLQDHLSFLYGVDMYAGDRGHDVRQYARALRRLEKFRNKHTLIKMKFDEALAVFEDESLDFVYIDGYAHTGEDDGKHFHPWLRKLRFGGILAGDDYSPAFSKVIRSVDRFISESKMPFFIIKCGESDSTWSKSPTWFTIKGFKA